MKCQKILCYFLFVSFLGPLIFMGCGKRKPEAKKELYALVPKSVGHPYWADCEAGMKKAGKELGVETLFTGPETIDVEKQMSIVEDLIAQKVSGIAISPNDPDAIKTVINKAIKAGIPVVTFDSDSPDSDRICYIGTDNKAAGKIAGEQLAKFMNGKGEVAILTGGLAARNLNERIEGFKEALKRYPKMKILDVVPEEDEEARALTEAENLLRAYPNLDGFFGTNAPGAPGAARAVKAAGKAGKIKVVGFDTLEHTLKMVKEGLIQATIGQRPYKMGYLSVKILCDLNKGKKPPQEIIDTGVDIVTKENVDQFLKPQPRVKGD